MSSLSEIFNFFVTNHMILMVCCSAILYGLAAVIYKFICGR